MDRFNRVLWTCIAVLLTAIGATAVVAGLGYLPGIDARGTPLPWLGQWRAWGSWAWLGLAVAGLVLSWLGWLLLRAELRRGGRRSLPTGLTLLTHEPGDKPGGRPGDGQVTAAGKIRLRSPALAHATERALERHPAIQHALVGLFGDAEHPELRARIDTVADTAIDLRALTEHLTHTVKQLTTTSGLEPDPIRITVRLGGATGPRVH